MLNSTELLKQINSSLAQSGSILSILSAITHIIEIKMGGTLVAILGIFFNVLVSEPVRGASITVAPA